MSAFLVSKNHIDALVAARKLDRHHDDGTLHKLSDDELGRMLWRENMLSLADRYDDPIDEDALRAYRFDPMTARMHKGQPLSPIALVKLVHCYRYQSCEHDAWESSDAARYCERLESMLVHRMPGYDEAPWGI